MTFNIRDIWYVWILRRHKHDYKKVEDGKTGDVCWPRHQCTTCKRITGLSDRQIKDLPTDMLYERIDKDEIIHNE